MRCITLLALLTVLVACKKDPPSKKSPDELIALLSTTGATIKKDGSYENAPPAEMNMKFFVDGEDGFLATRFPTTDLARDYCQTERVCFTVDYWAVRVWEGHASGPGWAKLLTAAGKPAVTSAASNPRSSQPAADAGRH